MENIEKNINYESLNVNPIFEPIKQFFEFYILSVGFVGQFDFQRVFLEKNPELRTFIDRYNKTVNLRKDGLSVKSDIKTYYINLGRIMAIALFNILESS